MLIITADEFYNAMVPFLNHKNDNGLYTEMVTLSDIKPYDLCAEDIWYYIWQKYYIDSSLSFVLLVGDIIRIPVIYDDNGSDPVYSLNRDTYEHGYPNFIIGRFSASNVADVNTMVQRSINYEKMKEQSWFHRGLGIGTTEKAQCDHIDNVLDSLLTYYHYASTESVCDPDPANLPTPATITPVINNGVSIIYYSAHGEKEKWSTTNFYISNVNELENDNKLPFIFSVACHVGMINKPVPPNYNYYPCFAESWLNSVNPATGNPTGAIAFYGSAAEQFFGPPWTAMHEFNRLLVNDSVTIFGALCFGAALKMIKDHNNNENWEGLREYRYWNIFGDPSIKVVPHMGCSSTNVTGAIDSNKTFRGCKINVKHVTITNGANVKFLSGDGGVVIDSHFEMEQNTTLEVK